MMFTHFIASSSSSALGCAVSIVPVERAEVPFDSDLGTDLTVLVKTWSKLPTLAINQFMARIRGHMHGSGLHYDDDEDDGLDQAMGEMNLEVNPAEICMFCLSWAFE
jgi:hypothetical protein